ncbi:sensor histidine kinase [Yinghuangia seranimata]|uniref:sensor histidine kinase n=1 Tax=Yinghuangia seranimata TaxID=408067 RepID=UPI00248B6F40|nr:histidine kinase [Yinghuangia seranimata]MDI2125243.1 histidine kinase [Yinghuangia seranimata]
MGGFPKRPPRAVRPEQPENAYTPRARRRPALPLVVAGLVVAFGVAVSALSLDRVSDGTSVPLGWSYWQDDRVGPDLPIGSHQGPDGLRRGDVVIAIDGHRLGTREAEHVAEPRLGGTVVYEVLRDGGVEQVRVPLRRPSPVDLMVSAWGDLAFIVMYLLIGIALYLRRPDEPVTKPLLIASALMFCSVAVETMGLPLVQVAAGGTPLWLYLAATVGALGLAMGANTVAALNFPAPTSWVRRRRWVRAGCWIGMPALMGGWAVYALTRHGGRYHQLETLMVGRTMFGGVSMVASALIGLINFRSQKRRSQRTRLLWVGTTGALSVTANAVLWQLPEVFVGHGLFPPRLQGLAGVIYLFGLYMAISRDQLWGLGKLVNRTVVYAATAGGLVGLYLLCVVVLDHLVAASDTAASAIAAVVVALVLNPLRRFLGRAANRVMFGDRADPAAALGKLGDQLAGVLIPSQVLPRVTDTVAASLRLPYVSIELADPTGEFRVAAETGRPLGALHTEPLRHQGRTIGRLVASTREHDEPWDPDDIDVLTRLAQQIGVAAYAVLLHEDLQRSRAAVVASREDERQRLRRDLHDGLGPALAAIVLKASIARKVVGDPAASANGDGELGGETEVFAASDGRRAAHGPNTAVAAVSAAAILDDIAAEARSAIEEIRHLVEALRPPALDQLGLVDALRARADALSSATEFRVEGPDTAPVLPAAVEVAAYRIALEAMTNTARHAGARRCTVRITAGELLEVEIRDDGTGIGRTHTAGTGLHSMAERAAEIGGTCTIASGPSGGTAVRALLPLPGAAPGPLPGTMPGPLPGPLPDSGSPNGG